MWLAKRPRDNGLFTQRPNRDWSQPAMSVAHPGNESQTQIRRVDAALRFVDVDTRLFAQSLHGEHFLWLGSPHYLVGNWINTEGGRISSDRLRRSENPGLLALKLFDCERTAITQLNESLKFTGYVTHKRQLYRAGGVFTRFINIRTLRIVTAALLVALGALAGWEALR